MLAVVAGLMRALPPEVASTLMGRIWRVVAPRLGRHRRALQHLAAAFPDRTEAERRAIAHAMWDHLGRVFAESFFLGRIVADPSRIDDRVAPMLGQVFQGGTGAVFVSGHLGNWELAVVPSLGADIPVAGLYQRVKNPLVERRLINVRRAFYPLGLLPKGAEAGRRLVRIVREGGSIGLLADLRERRGPVVPFLGRPAPSTPFPAMVARLTGAALVVIRVVRLKGVRFRIEAESIEVPRTADRDADIEAATAAIQARLGAWVREHPEQWMWAHRRWG